MKEFSLFSKTISKILAVFVADPKERFYLRQLCVLIGSSPRPVQLALRRLEKIGILKVQKEANIKFYVLDKDNPVYPEVKSIILKTEAAGDILRRGLRNVKNIQCAFIYGSVAKDTEHKASDIDVCIVGKVNLTRLDAVIAQLETQLKREISVVTFSLQEWRNALRDKKAFVKDILKHKKIVLIGAIDALQKT